MTAQLQIVQTKTESQFVCSACGADRACDCNAPALEREATRRELNRQAVIKHRNKKRQQNQQSCNITPVPVTEPDDDWTPEQEKAAAADYSRDLENNRANAAALVGAAIEAARKFKEIIEDDGVLTLQMKSQIFRAYDAWDEINAIVGSLGRMVNFHRPREAREELEREESESS